MCEEHHINNVHKAVLDGIFHIAGAPEQVAFHAAWGKLCL